MENNICRFTNGTLVVCHHFVDFVPTFVRVNFWCVYHILQYALCPRCKAILVGEGVDHLVLFVHIHGSINLSKLSEVVGQKNTQKIFKMFNGVCLPLSITTI
jgi:hypothetical protein